MTSASSRGEGENRWLVLWVPRSGGTGAAGTGESRQQVSVPCPSQAPPASQPEMAGLGPGGGLQHRTPGAVPLQGVHLLVLCSTKCYLQTQPEGKGKFLDLAQSPMLPDPWEEVVSTLTSAQMAEVPKE